MPKNKISEFDTTPANNTDVGGINVAENCAPSNINNAIRELMAQLKNQQTGLSGDNFSVGGNLTVTGTSELIGATKLFLNAASSTSAAPPLAWNGDSNTGIYSPAADTIAFSTAGTERLRISSVGTLVLGTGEGTNSLSGGFIRAPDASGTDIAGSLLDIRPGNGTGTGGSGYIRFRTADVGSSGSTANTLVARLHITPKGGIAFGSSDTNYGTTGQVLKSNGDAPPSFGSAITQATAKSASGASVDFTSIPSWVKKITVMIVGVSTAAAGVARIQLGISSGLVTTGYAGGQLTFTGGATPVIAAGSLGTAPQGIAGFSTTDGASIVHGSFVITNVTGNTWSASGSVYRSGDSMGHLTNGNIALSGTLDRLSIVATTSTFDAGTINIIYE